MLLGFRWYVRFAFGVVVPARLSSRFPGGCSDKGEYCTSGDKPSFASSSLAVEYADVDECVDGLEVVDVFEVTGESQGPVNGVSWPD